MKDEIVTQSYASRVRTADDDWLGVLYAVWDVNFIYIKQINVILRNCYFQDNHSTIFLYYGANMFMDNSTFTSDPIDEEQINNDYQIISKLSDHNIMDYDISLALGDVLLTLLAD